MMEWHRILSMAVIFAIGMLRYVEGQNRIVNGWDVSPPFKYSWIVRISFDLYPYPGQYCGATLISEDCILTAAHCSTESASKYTVEVHRHDLSKPSSQENTQTRNVSQIISHPDYGRFNGNNNDIAIWRLSSPINMVDGIEFITLDAGEFAHVDNEVSAIGWGTLEDSRNAPLPDILQQANVFIVNCQTSNYVSKMRYTFDPSEMCAAFTDTLGNTFDSCSGDSGGPLFDYDTNVQVGVVSWGISCALPHYPGVYSHVGERDNRAFIELHAPDAIWTDDNENSVTSPQSTSPEQTSEPSSGGEQPGNGSGEENESGLCPIVLDGRTGSNTMINGLYELAGFTNTRPHYQNAQTGYYLYFSQNFWIVSSQLGSDSAFAFADSTAFSADVIDGVWEIATSSGGTQSDPAVKAQCQIEGCFAEPLAWVADGYCDEEFHNTEECLWDGGDCCQDSCVSDVYVCGSQAFDCKDPAFVNPDAGQCDLMVSNRIGDGSQINGFYELTDQTNNNRPVYYSSDTGLYIASGPRNFWFIGSIVDNVGSSVALNRDTIAEVPHETTEPWRIRNIRGWEQDNAVRVECESNLRFDPGTSEECGAVNQDWLGDGWCDYTFPDYNTAACGYDGGDCCETTCEDSSFMCGIFEYYCIDPDAPEPDTCQSHTGFIDGPDLGSDTVSEIVGVNSPECCLACQEETGCVGWNYRFSGLCQLRSRIDSIVDDPTSDWVYGNFNELPDPDLTEIEFLEEEDSSSDTSSSSDPSNQNFRGSSPCNSLVKGYRVKGTSLGQAEDVNTERECCNKCAETDGCVAWNYQKDLEVKCFLRSTIDEIEKKEFWLYATMVE